MVVSAPVLAWHEAFPRSTNMIPLGESAQPNPDTISGTAFNSDIAFWRNYAVEGWYDGFRVLDISNPGNPVEVTEVKCGWSQGDITISPDGNVLVRSQDSPRVLPGNDPAQACTDSGMGDPTTGWEGLQIFDFSNKANPVFVGAVYTDCGSHTHTQYHDRANNRLIIYVSRGGCTITPGERTRTAASPGAPPSAAAASRPSRCRSRTRPVRRSRTGASPPARTAATTWPSTRGSTACTGRAART